MKRETGTLRTLKVERRKECGGEGKSRTVTLIPALLFTDTKARRVGA